MFMSFSDFVKAFDAVHYNILIHILNCVGKRDRALSLTKSYIIHCVFAKNGP